MSYAVAETLNDVPAVAGDVTAPSVNEPRGPGLTLNEFVVAVIVPSVTVTVSVGESWRLVAVMSALPMPRFQVKFGGAVGGRVVRGVQERGAERGVGTVVGVDGVVGRIQRAGAVTVNCVPAVRRVAIGSTVKEPAGR